MKVSTQLDKQQVPEGITSEALKINLAFTSVDVDIDPKHQILLDVVSDYSGLVRQAEHLLKELNHPYRNLEYVAQELWRYCVKNYSLYISHPEVVRICKLIADIFIMIIKESRQARVKTLAADHLLGFMDKLSEAESENLAALVPFFGYFFEQVLGLDSNHLYYLLSSYYQVKKAIRRILEVIDNRDMYEIVARLVKRVLSETYDFWLAQEDIMSWFLSQVKNSMPVQTVKETFGFLNHKELARLQNEVRNITVRKDPEKALKRMLNFPNFRDIVDKYRKIPEEIARLADEPERYRIKLIMLFKIMEIKGLESIHEETLREINYCIGDLIKNEDASGLKNFLEQTFAILLDSLKKYPEAALNCVRTIGKGIIPTKNMDLINFFIKRTVAMGFQTPDLGPVTREWQVSFNPAHLQNIRVYLELIELDPKRTRGLLSALMVNLALGGVYVRDTDLFQKDISKLLHADIEPVYYMVKQLAKLFPVYFNEIGAEGMLREVSTDIDEIASRQDKLIHFLRKQSHVESNNVIVPFTESIIEFWLTLDKEKVRPFLPAEIFDEIKASGPYVDEIHLIMKDIFKHFRAHSPQDLLGIDTKKIEMFLSTKSGYSDSEKERAKKLIQLYQLLHEKYALSSKDINYHLERAAHLGLPDPTDLKKALASDDNYEKLEAILTYLEQLKEVILSPCELKYIENIYHKRHIAVDIPSMYGTYAERKFDAMGLSFRLENMANVIFEDLIYSFNLSFITRATFFRIVRIIRLFKRALAIDGITSNRLDGQVELFEKATEIRRFSHSQYLDIFRGFSESIHQLVSHYYDSVHKDNLLMIIPILGPERLLDKYRRGSAGELKTEDYLKISEAFLRDLVARTFGLQYFDHFITSVITTLSNQKEVLDVDHLDLLLSYDPDKTISLINEPNPNTLDLIHLGNKGYNLIKLLLLGIPVPPGFVITTEFFRCRKAIVAFKQAYEDFVEQVREHISVLEEITGRNFGNAEKALLLSVRSGAAISMPGMMNTFLNVGINEHIVEGLIKETGEVWFAWDNYRRFLQSWGMAFGMQRDEFDAIMNAFKTMYGRKVKREFSSKEIRELTLGYRKALELRGICPPDDPEQQLLTAITQVVESWYSAKAQTYREIMGISENWGTAVTIQAMVFGNLDTHSGAGVMFTHHPRQVGDEIRPWGDFTLGNQGEDVVGGLVKTLPISEEQRISQGREKISLESQFPNIYRRLVEIAKTLIYKEKWGPQEIEFTFQGDSPEGLFILQSRNMVTRKTERHPVFVHTPELEKSYLASGIGVSGGALSGRVVFTLEDIQQFRLQEPETPLILIRSDTVPDDIREISMADGILTGKGGPTSHAAIVAHRLNKTCVVGCVKMRVWENDKKCIINGHVIRKGDEISIDGHNGAIYLGMQDIEVVELES